MKINKIKPNPNNPRIIRDEKFAKLKKSIQDFPKMLSLRPIVVDNDFVVLGGNMRFRALQDLGYKEIPDEWIKKADKLTDEEKHRFIIEDNVGFGEWKWEQLANEWDAEKLKEWGLDVPNYENIDIDLDAFFEEDNTKKEEKFKITLEYSEEDYNAVTEALKNYSGSKESIFFKLLGL